MKKHNIPKPSPVLSDEDRSYVFGPVESTLWVKFSVMVACGLFLIASGFYIYANYF